MSARVDAPLSPLSALPEREGLAYRDDLTGLYNRRLLSELLRDGWADLLARHGTVALILFDLDLFKEVNDTWGHMAGDEALRAASEQLRRHLRDTDLLIRFGGDEFVAVLPGVGEAEAAGLVERARQALEGNRFRPSARAAPVDLPITFSHGVAMAPRDGASGEDILRLADARLYEEKRRRRVVLEPLRGEHRRAWWRVAVPAAILLAVGVALWLSVQPGAVPPDAPSGAVPDENLAASPAAAAHSPRDVEGLLRQIADLQAQVRSLDDALQAERSQDNRAQYEQQLRELGGTIAGLQAQLVVAPPTEASPPSPPATTGPPIAAAPPPPAPAEHRPSTVPPSTPAAAERVTEIRAPTLAAPLQLAYPRAARQLRRAATVELLLTVEADGTVSSAEPVGPRVGLGFDEAAQQAALRARFKPGSRDGVAQRMQTRLSVRFELSSR